MIVVVAASIFLLPASFKTKLALVFIIILIGSFGISRLSDEGLSSQILLIEKRMNTGGSFVERIGKIQYVYSNFAKNPIFGNSAENSVYDLTGSTNHTFYLNILAIYGLVGFSLFGLLVISLLLPGLKVASTAQLLARFFLLMVWIAAPTNYLQVVALVIIIPIGKFQNKNRFGIHHESNRYLRHLRA